MSKKKLAQELKLQSGTIVAFIWECKKTKNAILETLYKERLIHMTHISAGLYSKKLLTQKQYIEISNINMAFITEEKRQDSAIHWVDEVLHGIREKNKEDDATDLFARFSDNLNMLFDAISDEEEEEEDEDEDDVSYSS